MRNLLIAFLASLPLISQAMADTSPSTGQQNPAELRARLHEIYFDAARHGDEQVLLEFVGAKFDLNTADAKGYTALILSAYNGHAGAVNLLLEAGADPCATDKRGNTALMGAIFKGELRIARRLMAADCQPDQRNHAGQTAAMYAALFGRTEIMNALAERGADLSATDAAGNSALTLAEGTIRTQ